MPDPDACAPLLSRRSAIAATLASGAALLVGGCSPFGSDDSAAEQAGPALPAAASAVPVAMTVFRDPSCGCCKSWAEIARNAGYQVTLRDDQDMAGIKRRLGVPETLASCHTALVDGRVIEGHVPLDDVARLLRQPRDGIRGLAVPGMPVGSPGMEVPDGRKEPFQVIAFDAQGNASVFRA